MITPKFDLIGKTFGRLTVLKQSTVKKNRNIYWECRCICGKEKTVMGKHLRNGLTKSCGCLLKDYLKGRNPRNKKHGYYGTPTYKSWISMKQRCKKSKAYTSRGICYDKRWETFDAFLNDMGERPNGTTLDRINVNGHYTPDNCRWATPKEQANNRRLCTCPYCDYHKELNKVII